MLHALCFPSQFGCTDERAPRYAYDPAKAKQLLAEAGFPNGFELDLYAYRERKQTEAMISYLRAVGIKANLRFMQYAAMREQCRADKSPLIAPDLGLVLGQRRVGRDPGLLQVHIATISTGPRGARPARARRQLDRRGGAQGGLCQGAQADRRAGLRGAALLAPDATTSPPRTWVQRLSGRDAALLGDDLEVKLISAIDARAPSLRLEAEFDLSDAVKCSPTRSNASACAMLVALRCRRSPSCCCAPPATWRSRSPAKARAPRTSRISAGSMVSTGRSLVQYLDWLGQMLRGDLGQSLYFKTDVLGLVLVDKLPTTRFSAVFSLLFALAVSIPLGVLAAVYPNTWIDRLCLALAVRRPGAAELLLRAHADHGACRVSCAGCRSRAARPGRIS